MEPTIKLTPELIDALQMFYIDQVPIEQVAKQTGQSEQNIEQAVADIVDSIIKNHAHQKLACNNLWGNLRQAIIVLGVFSVFSLTIVLWLFIGTAPFMNRVPGFEFTKNGEIDTNRVSSFGDSFNFVNALFSALAFAGVIMTIFLQSKELRLQRIELEDTRKELRGQKLATHLAAKISAVSGIIQGYSAAYSSNTELHDREYNQLISKLKTCSEAEREAYSKILERTVRGQLDYWLTELREIQQSRL